MAHLGKPEDIGRVFIGFQKYLDQQEARSAGTPCESVRSNNMGSTKRADAGDGVLRRATALACVFRPIRSMKNLGTSDTDQSALQAVRRMEDSRERMMTVNGGSGSLRNQLTLFEVLRPPRRLLWTHDGGRCRDRRFRRPMLVRRLIPASVCLAS